MASTSSASPAYPVKSGSSITLLPLSYHDKIADHIEVKLRKGGGALVVMGQGLGACELVSALLRRLQSCRPVGEPLILVTNAREAETDCIGAKSITADVPPVLRDEMYLAGGCISITSRILVTDLLTNRLTTEIVAGLIVLNAHNSSHCEQFACELYRERKQKGRGFIAAFTDHPVKCKTLMNVEGLLRELQIGSSAIVLIPRFRGEVMDTFKHSDNNNSTGDGGGARVLTTLLWVDQKMTHLGRSFSPFLVPIPDQIAAIEKTLNIIVEANFDDIAQSKGVIDAGIPIYPQNLPKGALRGLAALDNWFSLRPQLSMVWDQLGRRTQNMIRDADVLERLTHRLRSGDAATFFLSLLDSISAHPESPWASAGPTHQLISQARQRLYNWDARGLHLHIDPPPKWAPLQKAIGDEAIRVAKESEGTSSSLLSIPEIRITVVTYAHTSSFMTKALIDRGPEAALLQSFQSFLYDARGNDYYKPKMAGSSFGISTAEAQLLRDEIHNMPERSAKVCSRSMEGLRDVTIGNTPLGEPMRRSINVMVNVVDAFKGDGYMSTRLADFQPNVVILYDAPSILPIRVAERYTSYMRSRGEPPVHTVILQVVNSHEARRLAQSGVQEQQAFHDLISMEKSVSAMKPKDEWIPLTTPVGGVASSRAGGRKRKRNEEMKQTVLVDVRELRSNLPLELHRKGLTLLPYTLPVGDFILSRDICVERKSLPDLIGSLASGRLYRQAVSMSFNYRVPSLLVEVQETEAGALMRGNSARISDNDNISRLAALVLHFPSLRLLWSLSDRSTANLFVALKVRAVQQPDPVEAMKKRVEGNVPDETLEDGRSGPMDLVSKKAMSANPSSTRTAASEILLNCPGITPHILTVLRNSPEANTLKKLVNLDLDTMAKLMGPSAAKTFHKFVNVTIDINSFTTATTNSSTS